MSDDKQKDTEEAAMKAWARLVDSGKAPRVEPTAKPVFEDPKLNR